jgi:hypothetical protein
MRRCGVNTAGKRDEQEKLRELNDLALRFFPRSGAAMTPQKFVKAKT